MAAYMIVVASINDKEQFGLYRDAVMPLIAHFGGKHMRRGKAEILEGPIENRGIAMFEFLSMGAIQRFWNSPEYVPIKELRRGAATLEVWAVPGV